MGNEEKKTKPEYVEVEVKAATQDEAVAKAKALAEKQGYENASVLSMVEITFKVKLYSPKAE